MEPMGERFGISPLNGLTADMVRTRVTFLCADVVSFTAMTERLGDRGSLQLMRRVARLVQGEAEVRGGRTVEVRGDSFLLVVPSGPEAIECADAIHGALERDKRSHPDGGVEVRMAVHAGPVLQMHEHYFGRNVILPYRLLPLVGAGEIGITEAVDQCSGRRRSFVPKGFREEVFFRVRRCRSGASGPASNAFEEGHANSLGRSQQAPAEARIGE